MKKHPRPVGRGCENKPSSADVEGLAGLLAHVIPDQLVKAIRTKLPGGGSGPLLTFFLYALGIVEAFILTIAGVLAWNDVIDPWMVIVLMVVGCGMFVYVVHLVAGLADRHPENLMLTPVTETTYLALLQERTRGDSLMGEVEFPAEVEVLDAEVEVLGEAESKDSTRPVVDDKRREQKRLKVRETRAIEKRVLPDASDEEGEK